MSGHPDDGRPDGDRATSPAAVTMPPAGTGERRRRRTERDQARHLGHRRSIGFAAALVALVGALAALVAFGYRSLDSFGDEPTPLEATGTSVVPDVAPPPPRALVAHQDGAEAVIGVTVMVVEEGGKGGNIVFAPVGSMVEVPSFGLSPLRDAFALGGLPLLQQAVENLFGVAFDAVALLTPDDLMRAVGPAGALQVVLAQPVEVVTEAGRVETLFPAGTVAVAPGEVPALLEQRGGGSDLDRLVRHQAFWRAWLAAIAADPSIAPSAGEAGGLGEVLVALAAGDVAYDLLPVEVLATGTGPGDDLYAVRDAETEALVAAIAPDSSGVGGDRVRVQVLNGTGVPGLAQQVQPVLVPAGAAVTLTGNADNFDYETTQVVFYRDEDVEAARAVQRALGVGEVVRSLVPLDVVDVTVVVGADFSVDAPSTTDPAGA